jgi:hypothetical protein
VSSDVRKLPNGRWEARARIGGRDSRRLSKTFDRKGDAERWVTEIPRKRQLGEAVESTAGMQRLDEWIETYWLMHAIPTLEQTTRDNYAQVWDKHIRPQPRARQTKDITPRSSTATAQSSSRTASGRTPCGGRS